MSSEALERPNVSVGYVQDALFPDAISSKLTLVGRFGVPPFSFFDSAQGYWQERKGDWLSLGIRSELGRPGKTGPSFLRERLVVDQAEAYKERAKAGLLFSEPAIADSGFYAKKRAKEAELGRSLSREEFLADHYTAPDVSAASGTSVFDPVLCELVYRWFAPAGGRILDPFAGGSVRGIVAGVLGYSYFGVDLRPEQVESNREQAKTISTAIEMAREPEWAVGDSRNLREILASAGASYTEPWDLVFSCPPYFDLEVYSDDPADLSRAESYGEFLGGYEEIIAAAVGRLRPNRFAVWVVSDVRDERGIYRGLIADTVSLFERAGARFYNEAVLVSPVASASVRAARQFQASRKLVRRHQNVLTFFKGDPSRIKETFGEVAVDEAWR